MYIHVNNKRKKLNGIMIDFRSNSKENNLHKPREKREREGGKLIIPVSEEGSQQLSSSWHPTPLGKSPASCHLHTHTHTHTYTYTHTQRVEI